MYKRQAYNESIDGIAAGDTLDASVFAEGDTVIVSAISKGCLLYTSDAADERSSVDLGGRRIIKKKKTISLHGRHTSNLKHKMYVRLERIQE